MPVKHAWYLSIALAATWLLGDSGPVRAQDETMVLGLRSIEGDDDFTHRLTEALREQADAVSEHPVSERSVTLDQMSMAYGCEDPDAACMADMAAGLEVTRIIYGTVRRTSTQDDYDFSVSLNMFDAQSGSITQPVAGVVPRDASSTALADRAARWVRSLTGARAEAGAIRVRSDVRAATVRLDGNPMGKVGDEALVLEDIAPGEYEVEVRAEGYETYTRTIAVPRGEQVALYAQLEKLTEAQADFEADTHVASDSGGGAKWLPWTLIGVSAASFGGMVASMLMIRDIDNDENFQAYRQFVFREIDPNASDVCVLADRGETGDGTDRLSDEFVQDIADKCKRADLLEMLQYVFLGTGVVAGGVGIYLLLAQDSGDASAHQPASNFALRPRFGPDTARLEATLRF